MRIGSKVLLAITPKCIRRAIVKSMKKKLYSAKETGYYCTLYAGQERAVLPKEMLFPTRIVPFEETTFPVPAQAEAYLEKTYGDYKKLPPEEKRVVHHDFKYIDFENGYLTYKGVEYCEDKKK